MTADMAELLSGAAKKVDENAVTHGLVILLTFVDDADPLLTVLASGNVTEKLAVILLNSAK